MLGNETRVSSLHRVPTYLRTNANHEYWEIPGSEVGP